LSSTTRAPGCSPPEGGAEASPLVPRATLRVDVGAQGISELVFGEDSNAQVTVEHTAGGAFKLVRNASTAIEIGASGDMHLGGAAMMRFHGRRISFENRDHVVVYEVDGQSPVWDKPLLSIYAGDTVTWSWTNLHNVAQTDSVFANLDTARRQFYSGGPTLDGSFSFRFDRPGVYYYKSQSAATMHGAITVKQFTWEAGAFTLDGALKLNGVSIVSDRKEIKMFLADACPAGWVEVPNSAGYMLVTRPTGGAAGARRNEPFTNGEETRVPPHEHNATVDDPWAHNHFSHYEYSAGCPSSSPFGTSRTCWYGSSNREWYTYKIPTSHMPTATTTSTAGAASNPQIYVLLCQPA